jgi:two-component system chemotaxis response regulator CheY
MPCRVLIVDDALFMRVKLRDMLEKNGYDIVGEAANGEEAVAKYQELKPDLTTMDITMPGMDGVTAVTEIRKLDPDAKIIVCSAMGQQAMFIDAIQAGAMDFIVKPFQEGKVLEAMRRVARRR